MLNFLPAPLRGLIACFFLGLNSIVLVPILLVFTFFKAIIPIRAVRLWLDPILLFVANSWIALNSTWMKFTQSTVWDVEGLDGLEVRGWYLVNANHQSWADILVLQHVLSRRIPFLKFFLKQELIWVPFMGLAWWALDFPFMRRHSEAYLKKYPEMRAKDQETTRKACEKFTEMPTSVMNFLEGTRFTPGKHKQQQSPYKYLLKPKAGGIAMALDAMGEKFQSVLDVTIVYPDGPPDFWNFISGKMSAVVVRVQTLPVPLHLARNDYNSDPKVREAFSIWVKQLWQDKDEQIAEIMAAYEAKNSPSFHSPGGHSPR